MTTQKSASKKLLPEHASCDLASETSSASTKPKTVFLALPLLNLVEHAHSSWMPTCCDCTTFSLFSVILHHHHGIVLLSPYPDFGLLPRAGLCSTCRTNHRSGVNHITATTLEPSVAALTPSSFCPLERHPGTLNIQVCHPCCKDKDYRCLQSASSSVAASTVAVSSIIVGCQDAAQNTAL